MCFKLLFLSILSLFHIQDIGGSGIISVFLEKYDNPGGLGDNGNCCDGIRFICRGVCDHYFIVCVDEPQGSSMNIRQCSVGRYTTGVVTDKNKIQFSHMIGGKPNPQELPFEFWPGSALVKVEVWDSDSNNNDFVELLHSEVQMQASRSRDASREQSFQLHKRTKLDIAISVFCDENWYGPHCDVPCVPTNGETGHYECNADGSKRCHPGWTGETCNENINECESSPCSTPGGRCVDEVNGYLCVCSPGYTGSACESEIDECLSSPCMNNATCEDLVGRFVCHCPQQYSGDLCDSELKHCDSGPCAENATCVDVPGGFQCVCPANTTGDRCQVHLDACGDKYCHNGACILDNENNPACQCEDGWRGADCIENIDDCLYVECPRNMTCEDLVAGYECVCTGEDCEVQYACGPDTCSNGGSCMSGEMGYVCVCPDGYAGRHCEVTITNLTCEEHLCLNNATCHYINDTVTCECSPGYKGHVCEEYEELTTAATSVTTQVLTLPDPCASSPCYYGATCNSSGNTWHCACPIDFTGATCDSPTTNATNIIIDDTSLTPGFLYFTGTATEKDVRTIRRWLTGLVGDGITVYVKAAYCTSAQSRSVSTCSVPGADPAEALNKHRRTTCIRLRDTLGVLIYKMVKAEKPVSEEVMTSLGKILESGKNYPNTTLKITSEGQCEDQPIGPASAAEQSEKTVGAWLGRNWWVMIIMLVIIVVIVAGVYAFMRYQRQRFWQPGQDPRNRDISVSSTAGVLSQSEAQDALNSDRCFNNVLYEGEENEYATLT